MIVPDIILKWFTYIIVSYYHGCNNLYFSGNQWNVPNPQIINEYWCNELLTMYIVRSSTSQKNMWLCKYGTQGLWDCVGF